MEESIFTDDYLRIRDIAKQDPKNVPDMPMKNVVLQRIEIARMYLENPVGEKSAELLSMLMLCDGELKRYFVLK